MPEKPPQLVAKEEFRKGLTNLWHDCYGDPADPELEKLIRHAEQCLTGETFFGTTIDPGRQAAWHARFQNA